MKTSSPESRNPAPTRPRRRIGPILFAVSICLAAAFAAWSVFRSRPFRLHQPGVIRFALCQYCSLEDDPVESFEAAMRSAEEAVAHGADVIVLPEFSFATTKDVRRRTFSFWNGDESVESGRLAWFARRHGCYLLANHPWFRFTPRKCIRNETRVFGPDGRVCTNYQKRVLSKVDGRIGFSPGAGPVLAELPFGRIGMLICKDSTEPEKFEAYRDADLLLIQYAHLTYWGNELNAATHLYTDERSFRAKMVLPNIARNLCALFHHPVLAVNKTGLEGDFAYLGGSCVVSSKGEVLVRAPSGPHVLYADFRLGADGRILPENPVIPSPDDLRLRPSIFRKIQNRFFHLVAASLNPEN